MKKLLGWMFRPLNKAFADALGEIPSKAAIHHANLVVATGAVVS